MERSFGIRGSETIFGKQILNTHGFREISKFWTTQLGNNDNLIFGDKFWKTNLGKQNVLSV